MQNPPASNESGAQQPEVHRSDPGKKTDKTAILIAVGFVVGLGLLIALNMR